MQHTHNDTLQHLNHTRTHTKNRDEIGVGNRGLKTINIFKINFKKRQKEKWCVWSSMVNPTLLVLNVLTKIVIAIIFKPYGDIFWSPW